MSPSQDASLAFDLSETFAPIYWGFVVSLILGGITVVQGSMYFSTTHLKDRPLVRFTAMLMLSQMYFVYQLYIVKRLGMGLGRWLVLGSISGCAIVALGEFRALIGTFSSLNPELPSGGGVGTACVTTMYVFRHGVLSNRNGMFAIFFGVAKGFGTITDILATVAMCIHLTSARTGISDTNNLLNMLIGFVVHRGALVTLIQALLLITFYAAPRKLYW
ncbi:hypothetical protein DXG01_002990 [Tephrocybe rancida]|nr:hypothetical protein DXG01_002990 [Tephrocybe rancida]